MHRMAAQNGMTPIATLVVVALVGFGIFLTLRVAPVYIESYAVSDAISSLRSEFDLRVRSRHELYVLLTKRFDINDVKHITSRDIKKKVKIEKNGQFYLVTVKYDVIVPLFNNISLLFNIHKEIEL